MIRLTRRQALLVALVTVALMAAVALEPALAAPGGLIKQAARTTWGKVVFAAIVIFFLPLILWSMVKRAVLVRRAKKALREISSRAPQFAWLPLKERITDVFGWVHSAWDQRKMDLAGDYMTQWYVRNQQLQLDKWQRDGLRNVTSDVTIKSITPLHVCHTPGSPDDDRLVVEIVAQMRDYLVEEVSGRIVQGDKTLGETTTIWSFVRVGERWMLSNIESDATAMEYLAEPKPAPAVKRPA